MRGARSVSLGKASPRAAMNRDDTHTSDFPTAQNNAETKENIMKKLMFAAVLLIGAGVATSRADVSVRISAGHHNDRRDSHRTVLPAPHIAVQPPRVVIRPPVVVVAPRQDPHRSDSYRVREGESYHHYPAERRHHHEIERRHEVNHHEPPHRHVHAHSRW